MDLKFLHEQGEYYIKTGDLTEATLLYPYLQNGIVNRVLWRTATRAMRRGKPIIAEALVSPAKLSEIAGNLLALTVEDCPTIYKGSERTTDAKLRSHLVSMELAEQMANEIAPLPGFDNPYFGDITGEMTPPPTQVTS